MPEADLYRMIVKMLNKSVLEENFNAYRIKEDEGNDSFFFLKLGE
jgi:hypothetical protein